MADETTRHELAKATKDVLVEHGFAPGEPEAVSAARTVLERASLCRTDDIEEQNRHVREWAARHRRSVA
jgi:hypothetical protein